VVQFVGEVGAKLDLDPLDSLQHEQPEFPIEDVEVGHVVESCARPEAVAG
jgi:hypothetical protein